MPGNADVARELLAGDSRHAGRHLRMSVYERCPATRAASMVISSRGTSGHHLQSGKHAQACPGHMPLTSDMARFTNDACANLVYSTQVCAVVKVPVTFIENAARLLAASAHQPSHEHAGHKKRILKSQTTRVPHLLAAHRPAGTAQTHSRSPPGAPLRTASAGFNYCQAGSRGGARAPRGRYCPWASAAYPAACRAARLRASPCRAAG